MRKERLAGMSEIAETGTNGHGLASWWKLASMGLGAGAVLFGMISGFLKIDSRLEAYGKHLEELAGSVKSLADKSATLDVVDGKIEQACLRMALANNGRWVCPFAPIAVTAPSPSPRPRHKPAQKPQAATAPGWSLFGSSKQ
jgi:hypothetical protein